MSRFPKLTETFVLYEILAIEKLGVQVDIYPLVGKHDTTSQRAGAGLWAKFWEYTRGRSGVGVSHAGAAELTARANYHSFLSWAILWANLRFLFRKPVTYISTLLRLIRATWPSLNFLMGGLCVFPKSVFFAERILKTGVTHIHAHFANHPAAAANIMHRLSGIPYSFTAHGSDLHRNRRMLAEKVADAAFVVTVSNYNRRLIEDHCGDTARDKVVVIRCGVDTGVFQPVSRERRTEPTPSVFSLLCIGTLHEVKGQTHLIDACSVLHDRGMHFQLNFVGDGPDAEALQSQAERLGIEDAVVFHGRKSREQVVDLLNSTDAVVTPSVPTSDGRREGIPVVLMEAMACGLPVVASRLSGIPELVHDGECGLLAPPGDADALADAVQQLYCDQGLRARLGQRGRERVRREFDLYINAAQLANCFSTKSRNRTNSSDPESSAVQLTSREAL